MKNLWLLVVKICIGHLFISIYTFNNFSQVEVRIANNTACFPVSPPPKRPPHRLNTPQNRWFFRQKKSVFDGYDQMLWRCLKLFEVAWECLAFDISCNYLHRTLEKHRFLSIKTKYLKDVRRCTKLLEVARECLVV